MRRRNNVAVLIFVLLTGLFLPRVGFISALPLARHVPQGLKPAFSQVVNGTAEQAAEKVVSEQEPRPQRLKPHSKQCSYRSAEALRHPKSRATSSFSAACEAVPFQSKFKLTHYASFF